MRQVKTTQLTPQTSRIGALGKGSISGIVEQSERVLETAGGRDDIEQAIAVKIFYDTPSGVARDVDPCRPSRIVEVADVIIGGKYGGRYQPGRWNFVRILPQSHIGCIEQPTSYQIFWLTFEIGSIVVDCRLWTRRKIRRLGWAHGEHP